MRYLTISLLHPKILRGGSQQVAYELFKGASADGEMSAHLLAGIDPGLSNANLPPGAVFTGIDGCRNENLLLSYDFDVNLHLQRNWFVIEKLNEFFSHHHFDWIHFHHSLFVGLEMIEIIKRFQPEAKIFYTLHEYLPICLADGQLKKTYNKSLCWDPSPQACFKCFPAHSVDFFFLRKHLFLSRFALVDHFITPSHFTRERFIDWGLPAERITVIPNGQANLSAREERDAPPQEPPSKAKTADASGKVIKNPKFAFFGQMIDNKGAHLLIQAADILHSRLEKEKRDIAFEVHFYGGNKEFASQEYRDKLEELLNNCSGPMKRVLHFHGEYTHDQLPDIMRSVDCVVVPSTWFEVFGLVVSEAWMFGKPVIASDIGGLKERIQPGRNGLKFTPNDTNDLAEALMTYIEEYASKGKRFPGIEPPTGRREFWMQHKKLFESFDKKIVPLKKTRALQAAQS
jgi:glycosyltransferase involved in cell wall biosynthesis